MRVSLWAQGRVPKADLGQQPENKEHCGNLTPALQGFGLRAGIYLAQPSEGETRGQWVVWRLVGQKQASCTAVLTPHGACVDALSGPTPDPLVRQPRAGLSISNPERCGNDPF